MKTLFVSELLNGGECIFYLEDILSVQKCPMSPATQTFPDELPERVFVNMVDGLQFVLPITRYEQIKSGILALNK